MNKKNNKKKCALTIDDKTTEIALTVLGAGVLTIIGLGAAYRLGERNAFRKFSSRRDLIEGRAIDNFLTMIYDKCKDTKTPVRFYNDNGEMLKKLVISIPED